MECLSMERREKGIEGRRVAHCTFVRTSTCTKCGYTTCNRTLFQPRYTLFGHGVSSTETLVAFLGEGGRWRSSPY